MKLLSKKPDQNIAFGSPYAVLNLSKVGLRYFRFMIKASPASKARLVSHFVNHPNVGWIFSAEGWFNLAVGVWAKDNAEINDINSSVRDVLGKGDEIIYQSELTSLYGFGNRPVKGEGVPMPIVDSVFSPVEFDSLKLDYVKLLTLDSSLPDEEVAEILAVDTEKLKNMRKELETAGVIVGYQDRLNYQGIYYKVFVDTLSAQHPGSVKELTARLWGDTSCIYIERANGKYDLEFELILEKKSELKSYLKDFSEYKIAILNENLYTNLYPLNKVANLKAIKDTISGQEGRVIDFRNSKLWYLNYDGADSYLAIYENKKYFESMNKNGLDLFDEIARYVHEAYPAKQYSLIDIGSGDGFKGRVFIERMGEEHVKAYYPVDIQPIELASALKAHQEGTYSKQPVLLDIENLPARFPLKLHPDEGQIFVFFGGTYGNFKSSQINGYLRPLVSDPTAVVLVSMPIVSEGKTDEDIIQTYIGKRMEGMAFGPLSQLGFKLEDFEPNEADESLRIQAAMEDRRIVTSFVLLTDKVAFGKTFEKGTRFKMTTSWKPTLEQVKEALGEDFNLKRVFNNESMSIVAIGAK